MFARGRPRQPRERPTLVKNRPVECSPTVRGGQPTIGGIPVAAIADRVWAGEGVDAVADDYELTRADVIVACWYAGQYGLPSDRRPPLAATRLWRHRWGDWADQANGAPWTTDCDYDQIPEPPTSDK